MRQFHVSDHSRSTSNFSTTTGASNGAPNPFSTPAASIFGQGSTYPRSEAAAGKYFRSRRIRKDQGHQPQSFKKDPKEKFLWIIPVAGLIVGLAITGVMMYLKIGLMPNNKYCSVLDDDFSSGTLNPSIWTKEVEVGGFGNDQFDMTTADEENVWVQDGKLYIKPTLQDATLIERNTVINLTAIGTCTSDMWFNCVASTNITNGTIVPPAKSARINTKLGAKIKYGRVEVKAKLPKGDWLWPAIWMLPVDSIYGAWPASGEIDIMESRGNNYSYSLGGNDLVSSALHWGPTPGYDAYVRTVNYKHAKHSQFGDGFHLFGLEWTEKYIFTYVDSRLMQVFYKNFDKPFWPQGDFPFASENGTRLIDPWSQTGRTQAPFDQEFYLIINVAVGGENGWFLDGKDGKPWLDASPNAKTDFWKARDKWYPTWEKSGEMIVDRVQMWQKC